MAIPHLWRKSEHSKVIPIICEPGTPATLELVDGQLCVGLAFEQDDGTLRKVTQTDLTEWQASLELLMPFAVSNLVRQSSFDGWKPVDDLEGLSLYIADDGQAASRMLVLEHLLHQWPADGVLVAAPSSEQLMVVPMHSIECLEAFHVMALAAHHAHETGGSPLSNQVFWYDGETWHHIDVHYDDEDVRLDPPPEFLQALERLAAMNFVRVAAEA